MESIAVRNQSITAPGLDADLFSQFIEFVDRGEATTKTYINNLRQFAAWMHFTGCARPERKDIISFRKYLSTEHDAIQLDMESPEGWSYRTDTAGKKIRVQCRPNTTAQYLRSVRQFFRWTASCGLYPNIADNIHTDKISKETHRKDALNAAEVLTIEESILQNADARTTEQAEEYKDTAGRIQRSTEQGKRLYAMYLLAVNAGLRTVEISRANIKDVECKGDQAWIWVWGKGHAEPDTKKPIAREVKAAIDEYLHSRSDNPGKNSPLFVSTGNRSGGKRILPTTIGTMLKKAMQDAGYDSERLTAHSLRHTAGDTVMEMTDNLYLTQLYMRHSNPKTTEIYLHSKKETEQAEIAQRLYDLYHGKTEPRDTQLQSVIAALTPEQIEQLKYIASAMAK